MKNVLFLIALVLSLGLIGYLSLQLNNVEKRLALAEQRFADCQQVTFKLQNQLAMEHKENQGK